MGIYLNPGNAGFKSSRAGRYVDKSGLIAVVNSTIGKKEKLSCISRARRFGKSMAAQMLSAYYDRSCDSSALFDDLAIAREPSYRVHLNKYNVIYIDITNIIGKVGLKEVIPFIVEVLLKELRAAYPGLPEVTTLDDMLANVVDIAGGEKFVAIIDEWDAIIRDSSATKDDQKKYLEFLRSLFKSSGTTDKIFAAAYMTGILPIKKDGSQSAISEFREYTMLKPRAFEKYYGFTEDEVKQLCKEEDVDFLQMKRWYDGYSFDTVKSVYNPNSVMYAIRNKSFESYWQASASSVGLLDLINMNYDGLSDAAVDLLQGKKVMVEVEGFQNDTISFTDRDDVLTILIHYGYLTYDSESGTVRIPNEEIKREFARIIHKVKNKETLKRVQDSDKLIEDTVNMKEDEVAAQIEKLHRKECSPLHYNREAALRSVIKLAYFAYRDYYVQFEELPGGDGYADIVYIPKRGIEYPALVIELKWNDTAEGAIAQIKDKKYPECLEGFDEDILLVGISYDKEDKERKHHCRIEYIEAQDKDYYY